MSNPTLDLPAAPAEAAGVARRLAALRLDVTTLAHEAATEEALTEALATSSLLHFSGHGQSDIAVPVRSALRVAPAEGFTAALAALDSAPADAEWRVESEGEPHVEERVVSLATGDGGRLWDSGIPGEPLVQRRLERVDGTLWALYSEGQPAALGELWAAGEIMLGDAFGACEIAVLSACESGIGGAAALDEHAGLTAALQQAGVRTIVATLWPVLDPVAALFADLLYEELDAAESPVDAVSLVAAACDRLRLLGTREARTRLLELGRASGDPRASMTLEAFAHALGTEDRRPFEHPWHWAAFYATGHPTILIEEEARP